MGGSDWRGRSCFRLWGQRFTVGGRLRRPIPRPSITLLGHLHCDHAGQSCDCRVFGRVHFVYPTSCTSRSPLINTLRFLPVVLHHGTSETRFVCQWATNKRTLERHLCQV